MDGDLAGRAILVTGAGGGIGSAVATACAAAGAELLLADRDERVTELAARLGAGAETTDLAVEGAPEALVGAAVERLGRLDGVVHATGIQIARAPLAQLAEEDWQRILAINLTATVMGCRAAARVMESGSIVNVGSVSARAGMAGIVAYSATKAAVHQFSRGLALELAPQVRVNVVAPGYVVTGLTEGLFADPRVREGVESRIPAGHVATPEEIAPAIVFLLSDSARYITGEVLTVDGGLLSH